MSKRTVHKETPEIFKLIITSTLSGQSDVEANNVDESLDQSHIQKELETGKSVENDPKVNVSQKSMW